MTKTNRGKRHSRVRPRSNFDGQTLMGTTISGSLTASSNIASLFFRIDASNSGSVATSFNAIFAAYSEYRFKWVKFHWMPAVSPGVAAGGARIYMSTVHNPEQMVTLDAASASAQNSAAKTDRNMKSWNAWQRFTYRVPLMMRRKWFDINTNITSTVDNYDRSVQDYVLATADTVGATDGLGQFQMEYMVELRGLNGITT